MRKALTILLFSSAILGLGFDFGFKNVSSVEAVPYIESPAGSASGYNDLASSVAVFTERDFLRISVEYQMIVRITPEHPWAPTRRNHLLYPNYRIADLKRRLTPDESNKSTNVSIFQNLNELKHSAESERFALDIGRWNIKMFPNNRYFPFVSSVSVIANPRFDDIFDVESKMGTDGIAVKAGEIFAGGYAKAGLLSGYRFDELAGFLSLQEVRLMDNVQTAVLYAHSSHGDIFALNSVFNKGIIEAGGDVSYTIADENFFRSTLFGAIGVDFSEALSSRFAIGYHFNGFGAVDPLRYYDNHSGLRNANIDQLGKNYLLFTHSHRHGSQIMLSNTYLHNIDDNSTLIILELSGVYHKAIWSVGIVAGSGKKYITRNNLRIPTTEFGHYSDKAYIMLSF